MSGAQGIQAFFRLRCGMLMRRSWGRASTSATAKPARPTSKKTFTPTARCARELALERLSPRGLPYVGSCDWNDGMNRIGIDQKGNQTGGESVWKLAQFLAITLNNFSKLSELRGDIDGCEKYRAAAASLLLAVEKHAWATDRYARAFTATAWCSARRPPKADARSTFCHRRLPTFRHGERRNRQPKPHANGA